MKAVLELHKEILQGLQTIDAFSQDLFLPEELDLHLNRIQDSFVNELLDKGFADRQLRLDYIQDLIVKNKLLTVFISPTAFYYESGAVTSFLPGNYKHLLSTRVKVRETEDCLDIVEQTIPEDTYHSFVTLKTERTEPPYYSKVELHKINEDQSEQLLATIKYPITEKEDTFFIIKNLFFKANRSVTNIISGSPSLTELNFYTGKFTDTTNQGRILGSISAAARTSSDIKYKITSYNPDDSVDVESLSGTSFKEEIEVWNPEILDTLSSPLITNTTLLDVKELYDRNQNIFFFPKPRNPHITISDGLLFTYYSTSFLPEEVYIDYIREPQPISLVLNQGCELSESAANIVVNRVVEYLKLAMENPAYREVLQHNEIRGQK